MRWWVFIIAAYLLLVLQVGLAPHMGFGADQPGAEPQFLLVLAVFVALSAPGKISIPACGLLGFLLDLTNSYGLAKVDETGAAIQIGVTLIGPYTLGYLAGGALVVRMRPMLLRQHPLTLATMTLVAGAVSHIAVHGILSARQWYEPIAGFSPWKDLTARAAGLLYSAAVGLVLAYPLIHFSRFFGFSSHKPGQRPRGR